MSKKPTFAQAHARAMQELKRRGWKIKDTHNGGLMKVPHATHPDGEIRVWFKSQSTYIGNASEGLNNALSTHLDLREDSISKLLARVDRERGVDPAPAPEKPRQHRTPEENARRASPEVNAAVQELRAEAEREADKAHKRALERDTARDYRAAARAFDELAERRTDPRRKEHARRLAEKMRLLAAASEKAATKQEEKKPCRIKVRGYTRRCPQKGKSK